MNFMKGFTKGFKRGTKQNWNSLPMRVWTTGIISDNLVSPLLYKCIFYLSCVQIIFLTLQIYITGINHTETAFDQSAFELVRLVTVTHYLNLSTLMTSTQIILILTAMYALLIIFLFAVFSIYLAINRRLPLQISQLYLTFTYLHIMVMVLPISSVCLQTIFQVLNDGSLSKGYLVAAIIIEFFNLVYAIGGCLIYLQIKSADPFSRLNNFYMGNILAQKVILNLLVVTCLYRGTIGTFVLIPICFSLLFELGTKLSILLGIPFLKYKLNRIASLTSCVSTTFSILTLLHYAIINVTSKSWGYTYFLCAVIFFLLIWKSEMSYLQKRRLDMNFFEEGEVTNTFWTIQRLLYFRTLLFNKTAVHTEDKRMPDYLLRISGALVSTNIQNLKRSNSSNTANSSTNLNSSKSTSIDKKEVFVCLVRSLLSNSSRNSILFRLLLSRTLLHDQGKINEPCSISCDITAGSSSFSSTLSGLKIQSDVRKIIRDLLSYNIDVMDLPYYFRQTEKTDLFRYMVTNQIELHNKIYNELQQPKFVLLNFMRLNFKFFNDWKAIDTLWERHLEEFSKKSFGIILIYAFYNIFNRHDNSKGFELLNKYKTALTENLVPLRSPKLTSKTIFDPSNVAVIISAGKTSTGKIFNISPSVQKVFGHKVGNLSGKNINILMPKFFHSLHNSFILKKCDDENRIREIASIATFAIDIRGYLIPSRIISTVYPMIDEGLMIWGMIRTEKPMLDFAFVNQENELEGYTQGLAIELGLDTRQIYKVSSISKELSQALKYISRAANNQSKANLSIAGNSTPSERLEVKKATVNNTTVKSMLGEFFESPNIRADFEQASTPHDIAHDLLSEGKVLALTPPPQGLLGLTNNEKVKFLVKCEIKQYESKTLRLLILQKYHEEKYNDDIIARNTNLNAQSNKRKLLQPSSLLLDISRKSDNGKDPEDFSEQPEYSVNEFDNEPKTNISNNISKIIKPSERSKKEESFQEESTIYKAENLPIFRAKTKEISLLENGSSEKKVQILPNFFFTSTKSLFGNHKTPVHHNHDYIASLGAVSIEKIKAKKTNSTDMRESLNYGYLDQAKTNSVSEYKSQLITLEKLQEFFKLFKFFRGDGIKAIFWMMTLYTVICLVSLLFIYLEATTQVPRIKNTMEFTHSLLKSMNFYYLMLRAHFLIETDFRLIHGNMYLIAREQLINNTIGLKTYNHEIFNTLDNANQLLRDYMLAEDIKIYYDGFDNFLNSSDYHTYNYFDAMKLITAQSLTYAKRTNSTPSISLTDPRDFLNVNYFNDLLAKTSTLCSLIYDRVNEQVTNIQNTSRDILIIYSGLTFGLTLLSILVFMRMIHNNIIFSQSLFGQSYEEEISTQTKNLKVFQECIEQESFIDLLNANKGFNSRRSEATVRVVSKSNQNLTKVKVLSHTMTINLIFFFLKMCVFVAIGFAILVIGNAIFISNISQLTGIYNDMIKAGEISSQIQICFAESAQLVLNKDKIIKNQKAMELIYDDLDLLEKRITNKYTQFTLDFMQLLNTDYCQYKNDAFDCENSLNGIAKQGIFASIYLIKSVITTQANAIQTYTFGTPQFMMNVLNPDVFASFPLVYNGIVPALSFYVQKRANDLISIADQEASTIIRYCIICLSIALVTSLISWTFFYPQMMNDRQGLAKAMMILPLKVVLKNRMFKEFLLRDSKEFYQSISRHEETTSDDSMISLKKKKGKKKKRLFNNSEN